MKIPLTHPVWTTGGLSVLAWILYGGTLNQPFVQDDWKLISFFTFAEGPMRVISSFLVEGSLFYRPLSMLYHYAVYLVAGPNPVIFHALLIAWVIASAAMVLHTAKVFGFGAPAAFLTGIVWLGSAFLLQDTLLWMVGMNEPACLIFCLLSLCSWWKGRSLSSAVWLGVALLFKESAIYIPLTLGLYAGWTFLSDREYTLARLWAWSKELLPLVVICLLYLCLRFFLHNIQIPTEDHPYAVTLLPTEQTVAWVAYCIWFVQTALPWFSTAQVESVFSPLIDVPPLWIWIPFYLIVSLVLWAFRWMNRHSVPPPKGICSRNRSCLFFIWALAALAPFVIIPFHPYRYYLIHAWVPMILMTGCALRILQQRCRVPRAGMWSVAGLFAVAMIFGNAHRFQRQLRAGKEERPVRGVNALISKGTESRIITRDLPTLVPELSGEQALVFLKTNLMGVMVYLGPEVLYGQRGLHIYREFEVRFEEGSWVGKQAEKEMRFAPDQVSFFQIRDGVLQRVDPPNIK